VICGRSSCAAVTPTHDTRHTSSAASKRRRCRILTKAGWRDAGFAVLTASDFEFPGEIRMNINDKAPDFTLQDENGKEVASKDLRGKTVVLFFYPRADTPG
jgi:hypothetical protein